MKKMCGVCKIVGVIAVIGALNWGLIGLFNINLVGRILGEMTIASRVVYILVGLSGVMLLVSFFKVCPACSKKMKS